MKTEVKLLEIRDHATCIPALAIMFSDEGKDEDWILHRAGFRDDGSGNGGSAIVLLHLNTGVGYTDPFEGGNGARTMPAAHQELDRNWAGYASGAVLDVRVSLGERKEPVVSDRVTESPYQVCSKGEFCFLPKGHEGSCDDIPF